MLSIELLGTPKITVDGRSIELLRRKSRALVYYLAANSRPVSRTNLLAFFWPDLERTNAQQTLRATLHSIRQSLGPYLLADKGTLALPPETQVDVRLLESTVGDPRADTATLHTALDSYKGEFLAGFSIPDPPEFDDWVATERERYRRLAIRGLAILAEREEKEGHLARAVDAVIRALTIEPLQEDLQRAAMRLQFLAGDRAGSIRRYENLRQMLEKELGVPPMAETRALYEAIVNDRVQPRVVPSSLPGDNTKPPALVLASRNSQLAVMPFIGRVPQMQQLRETFAARPPKLALVEGEPGIGKTRLIEEFLRNARGIILSGVAHELEHAIPYQSAVEALRSLLAHSEWSGLVAQLRTGLPSVWRAEACRLLPELTDLFPATPRPAKSADEWRVWEGLNQFLQTIARQRPVVLFLDDLHWADSSTLGLLGYLLRQTGTSVSFIAATRPFSSRSPLGILVQSLTREGRIARVNLSRLTANEVAAIAHQLSVEQSESLAQWLIGASEGNPYVLSELIRNARDQGYLSAKENLNLENLINSNAVPPTIYSLIQSRLNRLSEPSRRFLDAAVAIGREFEFRIAMQAAAISEIEALDALDELRNAGLIVALEGENFAIDHSLTMEVAYREVNESRHRLLHRRVAEALEGIHHEQLDAVAGLLAWHFAEGNEPERAASYAYRAGQQADRLAAWPEAIAFYEKAVVAPKESQRFTALMALGEAHTRAGQAGKAGEVLREAVGLAQAEGQADQVALARLALGRSFLLQARYEEAVGLAQQIWEMGIEAHGLEAQFLWGTALSLEGADLDEAQRHLTETAALCQNHLPDKLILLAQSKFELGSIAAQQGDIERAIDLYNEALEIATRAPDRDEALTQIVLAHNNLAYHLNLAHDPAASEHAALGLQLAQDKGLLAMQTFLLSTLGEIALASGDLGKAEDYFAEGLTLSERLSIPERIAGLTANVGLVALKRGTTASAIHHLSKALTQADALRTRHLAAQIRLWLAPLLPPAEARVLLAEARALAESGNRRRLLQEVVRLEKEIS